MLQERVFKFIEHSSYEAKFSKKTSHEVNAPASPCS